MEINIYGINFQLNFGLKQLILLNKNSNINAIVDFPFLFSSLFGQDLGDIAQALPNEAKTQIIEEIYTFMDIPSIELIKEYYTKAVGEIGISPQDALRMTIEEIDLAYEGYLRRLESQANLINIAVQKALRRNSDLIKLTEEKEYSIGTNKEREETFSLLNI